MTCAATLALASVTVLSVGASPASLGAPGAAAAAGAPRCATAGLVVWLNDEQGGGTAGSVYYKLELTNLSGHTCVLHGYPTVWAVDLRGRELGSGASREALQPPRVVTLANGAGASAGLRVIDAGALPACGEVTAAGLRVYPPGQTASKVVPFPFPACSHAGRGNLAVRAVTATR